MTPEQRLRRAIKAAVARLKKCQPELDEITLALIAQTVAADLGYAARNNEGE